MAISAKKYLSRRLRARELSFHFYLDFGSLPLACPVDNRILLTGSMDGSTTTVCIALKTELATLELSAHQQGGGGDNNA
jgi:hypothetical protein